jgi:hypothetical protein
MTPKGAFKVLKNTLIRTRGCNVAYSKALHLAMAALEKQVPIKVVFQSEFEGLRYCPCCNVRFIGWGMKYCGECGQALDWSDTE